MSPQEARRTLDAITSDMLASGDSFVRRQAHRIRAAVDALDPTTPAHEAIAAEDETMTTVTLKDWTARRSGDAMTVDAFDLKGSPVRVVGVAKLEATAHGATATDKAGRTYFLTKAA